MASNSIDRSIVRGDKTINPTDLFGIWKDAPRNIIGLRNPSQPKDQKN